MSIGRRSDIWYINMLCFMISYHLFKVLRLPDTYDAKTTEKQTSLSHFAWLFDN